MASSIASKSPFKVKTIEMHTGGEPLRVIVSGYPAISGETILAKRRYAREQLDYLRKALMLEPRGHYDMYGALLVEPDLEEADLATLFIHNEGYSTMCGHATFALARYAVDFGLVQPVCPETPVNLQCPCGIVKAFVEYDEATKTTGRARFQSVPAFVFKSDVNVDVPGYGLVTLDISYGGAFYALTPADQLGLDLSTSSVSEVVTAATAVSDAVKAAVKLDHPDSPDLAFLYGTIVTDGNDEWSETPTKNICVFADRQVDRSPTGSGVTARIALQVHKGLIQMNQSRVFKNAITGSEFTGKGVRKTGAGARDAVVVEVGGKGQYVGESTFFIEADDELGQGFLVK